MNPENKKTQVLRILWNLLERAGAENPRKEIAGIKTACKYKKSGIFSGQKPQAGEGIQCWLITSFRKCMLFRLCVEI